MNMTRFRALPVRRGDAFLLQSARGDYLVDGGASGCGLPEMLNDRKVRKLRAAICTGTRPERLGGVVDLLRSGKKINEIWLPSSVRAAIDAACRFNGDWTGWRRIAARFGENAVCDLCDCVWFPSPDRREASPELDEAATTMLLLGFTLCIRKALSLPVFHDAASDQLGNMAHHLIRHRLARSDGGGAGPSSARDSMVSLMSFASRDHLVHLCADMLDEEADALPYPSRRSLKPLIAALSMMARLTVLCGESDACIRYFRHTGRMEGGLVPRHPFRCLNGVEESSACSRKGPLDADTVLHRFREIASVSRSLVFQYGDKACGALFCSDSRFHFLGQAGVLHLDRPSVITAPRQGNVSAASAYDRIVGGRGRDHFWVRTHYSNARKVTEEFRERANLLCLYNCVDLAMQEVLLAFEGQRWNRRAGGVCACGGSVAVCGPPL